MLNIVKKPNPFILKILKKEGFGADCSVSGVITVRKSGYCWRRDHDISLIEKERCSVTFGGGNVMIAVS